jgi:hypothetical protein
MRTINVVFEDGEYDHLKKMKGNKARHDFIMDFAKAQRNAGKISGAPKN